MFNIFKKSAPAATTAPVPAPAQIPPVEQANQLIELGNQHEDDGQFDAAIAHYQQALALVPGYWRAHLNLGNVFKAADQVDQAFEHYRMAHAQLPQHHATCYNLGCELIRLRRMDEAIALLRDAVRIKPDFADAMVMLAEALEAQKQLAESLEWLNLALTLRPDEAGILFNKLVTLEKLERYEEGEAVAQQLIQQPEGLIPGLDFLAEYAKKYGEVQKALAYYRQMPPAQMRRSTYSNYLLTLTYDPHLDPAWVLSEHKRFNDYLESTTPVVLPPRITRIKRRIGFISPDFSDRPVATFILKLFELLNRERFEVWGYYVHSDHDAITDQIKRSLDGWRELSGLRTQAAAELIAQDGVDILVDLAGHTGSSRLDVLALKPAPVIATWLGYLGTTGLDTVDFRIVDGYTDPPGMTETHHTEQLVRLAHSQWCYLPRDDHPAVESLPALRQGGITFGSFNNFVKICDEALALWAQLLARVPNSRLLIAAIPVGRSRQRVTEFFTQQGVSPTRLEFVGRTSFVQYLTNYNRVDIALDSFPYNGATTTCDALYMGVPVLTLAGQHSVARSGVSLMTNIGLPEWVAHSPQEFLDIGARLAADIPALAQLRAGLRKRFMASPLGDQKLFARDFEAVLDEMWRLKGSDSQTALHLPRLRLACESDPGNSRACYELAVALVSQGDSQEAVYFLRKALGIHPDFYHAMVLFAEILMASSDFEEGLSWSKKALAISENGDRELLCALFCLDKLDRIEEGESLAVRPLSNQNSEGKRLQFLARFSMKNGEIDKGLLYYRRALALGVDSPSYSSYLLALMSSFNMEQSEILEEHKKFNQFFTVRKKFVGNLWSARSVRRIGFISPDLRGHAVALFVEKLFLNLDRSRFEVFIYSACSPILHDNLTGKIRECVDGWVDVNIHSGQDAASIIARDCIDILIDLSGHTAGNRLDVLVHQPAPVIATWLGYLGTTGLDTVDFRIVDGYTDPPGMTETHHTEQLVRLAHSQWCYLPRDDHPAVESLPALRQGGITFGSFNNFVKICDEALALWAQLLARVPNSRLLIAAIPVGRSRQRVTEFFTQQGVSPTRLEFVGRTSFVQYLTNYNRVDIALDSFPYNGATTTCDALYMGVPVLTLAGQHSVARSGVSLMTNIGLPEWVAHSPQEFLDIGARLAADIPALAQLRAGLRKRFMASPLGDQALFARDFEAVLDEMWRLKMAPKST